MNKFQGMSAPAQLSDAPKGRKWEEHQRIKEGEEGFARSSSREAQLERQLKEQQLDELEEELRNKKKKMPNLVFDPDFKKNQERDSERMEAKLMEAEKQAAGNPRNFELNYKANKEKERKMNAPNLIYASPEYLKLNADYTNQMMGMAKNIYAPKRF